MTAFQNLDPRKIRFNLADKVKFFGVQFKLKKVPVHKKNRARFSDGLNFSEV